MRSGFGYLPLWTREELRNWFEPSSATSVNKLAFTEGVGDDCFSAARWSLDDGCKWMLRNKQKGPFAGRGTHGAEMATDSILPYPFGRLLRHAPKKCRECVALAAAAFVH